MANEAYHYQFLNTPSPQVVTAGVASEALGWTHMRVCATEDCFVLVSADGTIPTDGTNGHFMVGGSTLPMVGLDPTHKISCSAGTLYVSAIG